MLEKFGDWVAIYVLNLSQESRLAQTVSFFVMDIVKIFILLLALITLLGFLRSFIPQERIRYWMGKSGWVAHFWAVCFGAVTPFCSCSSIPVFFAFLKAGIPLGVVFSFLITSPIVNEYVLVIMIGLFGWKIALAYVFSGMFIGFLGGLWIKHLRLERYLVDDFNVDGSQVLSNGVFPCFWSRILFGWREAVSVMKRIWIWIIIGVGVGAVIHNYVPQESIKHLTSVSGFWGVPVATLMGVPLYGSCAAVVPIAIGLFQKGMPLGTALAFLMAISALSLPEAIMLRRAILLPLIAIFFCITAIAIILIGYIFNFLQPFLI